MRREEYWDPTAVIGSVVLVLRSLCHGDDEEVREIRVWEFGGNLEFGENNNK